MGIDVDKQYDILSSSDEENIDVSVDTFNVPKTELETLLWDKNIAIVQQVEQVLQTYNHTPSVREDFLKYFTENIDEKTYLIEDIQELQGDTGAIQQKILEYIARSCKELKMYTASELKNIASGKRTREAEQAEINDGKAEINDGKAEINDGKAEINDGKAEIEIDIMKAIALKKKMLEAKRAAEADGIQPTEAQQIQAEQLLQQQGILQQLDHSPLVQANPQLKSDYVSLLATKIAYSSPENADKAHRSEFFSLIKGIENDLNIPDTSHNSYSLQNAEKTKSHLFDEKRGNESYKKQRDKNLTDNHQAKLNTLTQEKKKDLPTLLELYTSEKMMGVKLGDEDLSKEDVQALYTKVQEQLRNTSTDTEEQKKLSIILQGIDKFYDEALPTMVEENLLLAMTGGVMQYFPSDTTTAHNLKNDLTIQGNLVQTTFGTSQRTMMQIDYSQLSPRIFVGDFLHKKENGNYGVGPDQFNPTILSIANERQLLDEAIAIVQSKQWEFKKQAKNPTEYQALMSKEVYANLMKMYEGQLGNKAIAQEVMKDAVDKSITTQKTFDLIKTLLWPDTPLPPETSWNTPQPYLDFIVGFDIYIENSTGEERRIRKENITKLHTVIKNAQQGKFSNNNCEMFRDSKSFSKMLANTKQLIEGKAVDWLNLFSIVFAPCIPREGKPNVQLLDNLMKENEKTEPEDIVSLIELYALREEDSKADIDIDLDQFIS